MLACTKGHFLFIALHSTSAQVQHQNSRISFLTSLILWAVPELSFTEVPGACSTVDVGSDAALAPLGVSDGVLPWIEEVLLASAWQLAVQGAALASTSLGLLGVCCACPVMASPGGEQQGLPGEGAMARSSVWQQWFLRNLPGSGMWLGSADLGAVFSVLLPVSGSHPWLWGEQDAQEAVPCKNKLVWSPGE